ncbi:TonB-dependent receptor [Comamonadaceae bacterium OH2545_COT-014]|nr:TonB-dependent receptor [Comamonadaceae bacterium OH2545_COT-014]
MRNHHSFHRLALLPAALALAFGASVQAQPAAVAPAQAASDAAVSTLPEVTIRGFSSQRTMRPGALREEIVMTESIGARTIEKTGASNINEAVDKNPGIAVQVECSICNVRNVLLNNLPGRYTTLLIDGIPIYSSVSSAYGLDSVGLYGLERIDIARGAGASLIAPEALAGTVNLVTKWPTRSETQLRVQGGSFGARRVDAFLARPLQGGAITASLHADRHKSVDGNGDGISEYTGYDRRMAGLGWFVDDLGGFKVRGRLDLVDEKRGGGALGRDYGAIRDNMSGNPFDFSRGPNGSPSRDGWVVPETGDIQPYEDGRGGFSEIIFTKRTQFVTSGERRLGDGRLRLSLGAAYHDQDSFYEGATYLAKQHQYYADANYQWPVGPWLLTAGASYRYENLRSHGAVPDGTQVNGIDNYSFRVPALYVQGYRTFLGDKLELNASLRLDHHNVYGNIVSPRLNTLYHHTDHLSSRLSLGKGFRAPTSFFEQDHGILDTIRIQREVTKPEVSHNLSYAINYADDRFAITSSYNFNRIRNMAMLDSGQTDANGDPITLFTSAERPVTVQGVDVNMTYQLTPALALSGGAELYHYRFDPGTLVFARPKARAFASVDYERGPWSLSARLNVTGPMDLRKFHDDGSGQQGRYNFDGTPKRDKSPTFATVDVRAQYAVHKNVSLYLGVDNLFDYKQADKENFLWVDASGAPDVTHLWGPNRGRFIYVGAKFDF